MISNVFLFIVLFNFQEFKIMKTVLFLYYSRTDAIILRQHTG